MANSIQNLLRRPDTGVLIVQTILFKAVLGRANACRIEFSANKNLLTPSKLGSPTSRTLILIELEPARTCHLSHSLGNEFLAMLWEIPFLTSRAAPACLILPEMLKHGILGGLIFHPCTFH